MLQSNTMRFATDGFIFSKQALLVSKVSLDTSGQTEVNGFVIDGVEPDGSKRRLLFKVNDKLYKFSGQTPVEVSGAADFDNVITNGNTVAEVGAVTSIPDWLNCKIYPIIALYAPNDATVMPTIKIALKVRNVNDVYEMTFDTAEVELAEVPDSDSDSGEAIPRISDIDIDSTATGNAAINITARILNSDGWTDFMAVQSVKDVDAYAIQFRIRYTVSEIGGADTAKVNKIVVRHTTGTTVVSGDTAEIYSVQKNYESNLGTCAVSIRHRQLFDSKIRAFVSFVKPTQKRTFLPLGISNGTNQTLILGEDEVRDPNIDQSTLQIFSDGNPLADFSYNTQVSEVTINTSAGRAITASYEYGRGFEEWREMTVDVDQQPYNDGTRQTRFIYQIPEGDLEGQTITNIRLLLERTSGSVEGEVLGYANGVTQQFVLQHAAKSDTLKIPGAAFSYNEDSQVVTLVAPAGVKLVADYDWLGESHVLYSWAAAWSPST